MRRSEAELRELVDLWAQRLGLDRHLLDVRVENDGLEADEAAATWPADDYDEAVIRFAPWVIGQATPPPGVLSRYDSPGRLEALVVHELLHVRLGELDPFAAALEDQVHRDVWSVAQELWKASLERTVDRLAKALIVTWPS